MKIKTVKLAKYSFIIVIAINIIAITYWMFGRTDSSERTKRHSDEPTIVWHEINLPRLFPKEEVHMTSDKVLINVWGTWCSNCHVEHPLLLSLAKQVPIVGINWYDAPENAKAYLAQHGNPFTRVYVDEEGVFTNNLGVRSAPETFLVDQAGKVLWRKRGVLKSEIIEKELLPLLRK